MSNNINLDLQRINKVARKEGLDQKKWYVNFQLLFTVLIIVVPITISFLSDYFGYINIEIILICGGLLLCFILMMFASFYIFKKEGDSRKMLVFRALILPLGFVLFFLIFSILAVLS